MNVKTVSQKNIHHFNFGRYLLMHLRQTRLLPE